ncbi:MAG: hypothetical protein ACLRT4_00670 [Thomasclavelia sp.]
MIIIIFFDLAIIGFLAIFLLSLLGAGVSSIFNVLPNYINVITLVLFIVQLIKQYIVLYYENIEFDNCSKIMIVAASLVECFRCLTLAIIVCNWLASYSASGLFALILTGISFIFDIIIYGTIIIATEYVSVMQVSMLSDSSFRYLVVGVINAIALFIVVNLMTNGALIKAFETWLSSF